jgi:hypothetical protein
VHEKTQREKVFWTTGPLQTDSYSYENKCESLNWVCCCIGTEAYESNTKKIIWLRNITKNNVMCCEIIRITTKFMLLEFDFMAFDHNVSYIFVFKEI